MVHASAPVGQVLVNQAVQRQGVEAAENHLPDRCDRLLGLVVVDWRAGPPYRVIKKIRHLFGDAGDDNLRGDGINLAGYLESVPGPQHGNDILDGGAGKDSLTGQGGDDERYGGTEDDQLWGDDTDTKSTPLANHGNDYLDGGDGADQLSGGGKNDVLYGGIANDTMFGDDSYDRPIPVANDSVWRMTA